MASHLPPQRQPRVHQAALGSVRSAKDVGAQASSRGVGHQAPRWIRGPRGRQGCHPSVTAGPQTYPMGGEHLSRWISRPGNILLAGFLGTTVIYQVSPMPSWLSGCHSSDVHDILVSWCPSAILGMGPTTATRVSPTVFPLLLSGQSCFCTPRPRGGGPGPPVVRLAQCCDPAATDRRHRAGPDRSPPSTTAGRPDLLSPPGPVTSFRPKLGPSHGAHLTPGLDGEGGKSSSSCAPSPAPPSQALAPRESGCLLGLRFGSCGSPPSHYHPGHGLNATWPAPEGKQPVSGGDPLQGASSWSGPAGPGVLRAPPRSPGKRGRPRRPPVAPDRCEVPAHGAGSPRSPPQRRPGRELTLRH
ncbi:hypothetical protein NDU88_000612 [Pleurodeles waltl]|uniref:Uncharacterized protein n=1 Tax=Pleurodeles waltl TaxID=8319 RepID=A0AAV7MHD5_PLEWA|nr:hypothetical protein NDU88_000612 [Pleurodeles waltl]